MKEDGAKREVKFVKSFTHDWRVVEKRKFGKINFYLLQDTRVEDRKRKRLNVFSVLKESKDLVEKFSGRIIAIEDMALKHSKTELRANGKYGVKYVTIEEPYIHKIMDVGFATDKEVDTVFGDLNLEGYTVQETSTNSKEQLFSRRQTAAPEKVTPSKKKVEG